MENLGHASYLWTQSNPNVCSMRMFDPGVSDIRDGCPAKVFGDIHSGGNMRTLSTALATATITALLTAAPAQSADDSRPPSRPASVMIFGGSDQIRVGWSEPARTGSHPIRRYVIRWSGGRTVVPARSNRNEVNVGVLDPGRYVFKVKAVSRAGSSPWARSQTAYVE